MDGWRRNRLSPAMVTVSQTVARWEAALEEIRKAATKVQKFEQKAAASTPGTPKHAGFAKFVEQNLAHLIETESGLVRIWVLFSSRMPSI